MGLVWLEEVVRLQLGPGVESAAGRAGGGGDWEAEPRQLRPSPPSNALKPAKKKGAPVNIVTLPVLVLVCILTKKIFS